MGNTCKPMAVLFQCMTKFTTNKKKKKKVKKKKKALATTASTGFGAHGREGNWEGGKLGPGKGRSSQEHIFLHTFGWSEVSSEVWH